MLFFCWKLSKSALLCFIFGKMCFIFVSCLSGWNYPQAVLCQDLESIYFWQLFCKFLWGAVYRVPTWTGKPQKMGSHFPIREKSGNFDQTGKVRENHTKY